MGRCELSAQKETALQKMVCNVDLLFKVSCYPTLIPRCSSMIKLKFGIEDSNTITPSGSVCNYVGDEKATRVKTCVSRSSPPACVDI